MSFEVESQQHLRALSHPVRLQLLSLLTPGPKSGTELAGEVDMSQAAVSYHLRQLADAGIIELAETRNKRGGQEKRYRLRTITDLQSDNAAVVASASATAADLQRRIITGKPETWDFVGDVDIWIDDATYRKCVSAIGEAFEELHRAAVEPGTKGAVHVSATAMTFTATRKRTKK